MLYRLSQHRILGLSSETKPPKGSAPHVPPGTIFIETDTGLEYIWDGELWRPYQRSARTYLWNTDSLEWEAATKGTGVGGQVAVTNFPAVISGSVVPVTGEVEVPLYTVRMSEDGGYTYVGKAVAGSAEDSNVWQIMRIDESAGMKILFADGNTNFDNVWSNRTSLNYS